MKKKYGRPITAENPIFQGPSLAETMAHIESLDREIEPLERELGIHTTHERKPGTMNYSTAVFLINEKVRAISCSRDADKSRCATFKTLNETIKDGDFVVVPFVGGHGMGVVKVVEVDVDLDFDSNEKIDWIIGVVDRADFEELTIQEDNAIKTVKAAENKKKRDDMRANLMAAHAEKLNKLTLATKDTPKIEKYR